MQLVSVHAILELSLRLLFPFLPLRLVKLLMPSVVFKGLLFKLQSFLLLSLDVLLPLGDLRIESLGDRIGISFLFHLQQMQLTFCSLWCEPSWLSLLRLLNVCLLLLGLMCHLLQYALFVIQLLLQFPLFLYFGFVSLSPKSLMVLAEELTVVVFVVLEGRFVPCQRLLEDRILPRGAILQHPLVLYWFHVVAVEKRLEWTHVRLACPRIQQRVRIDRAPGSLMCFGDLPDLCSGGWTLLPTIAQVSLQIILQLSTQRGPMLLNDVT